MHEHDCDHEHDHEHGKEGDQATTTPPPSLYFGSNYHEHGGEPCTQLHHPSCPTADAVFCTPLSTGGNGCTEIWFSASSVVKLKLTPAEIDTFKKAVHAANLALVKRQVKPGP